LFLSRGTFPPPGIAGFLGTASLSATQRAARPVAASREAGADMQLAQPITTNSLFDAVNKLE
jgi:hypothetical protein